MYRHFSDAYNLGFICTEKFMAPMSRPSYPFFCLLLMALLLGCSDPPEIRQYKISKERSDLGDIGMETGEPTSPQRMVVAIAERPDATWFLKVFGPKPMVDLLESQWRTIFKSFDFDESGKPTWDTPDGWRLGPTKPMRFATLVCVATNGELEVAISSLGPNQNMLDNVNRWRGQLELPGIQKEELKFGEMTSAAGELKIFDAVSRDEGESTTKRPPLPFKFELPDGWKEGVGNSIVKLSLVREDTEKKEPQMSVSSLPAAVNKWLPNAQRWARQVSADQSPESIRELTTEIAIDGNSGNKIRFVQSDADSKSLIAIMFVRNDEAWFLKFFGTSEQVVKFENDFDTFVDSIQFK